MAVGEYHNFKEFYPYYLSEHKNTICKRLHFIGSLLTLVCLLLMIILLNFWLLLLALICGYGFAWVGHFFFERNKPATFKYPIYSFIGDWVMFKDILIGKIKF